jgi:hypothetical protein
VHRRRSTIEARVLRSKEKKAKKGLRMTFQVLVQIDATVATA